MRISYTNIWNRQCHEGGSHSTPEIAQFSRSNTGIENQPHPSWVRVEMRVNGHWFRPPVGNIEHFQFRIEYTFDEYVIEIKLYELYDWAKQQYEEFGFISDSALPPCGPVRSTTPIT